MPTWERDAQDAAEAEHPPPKMPQDEPAFQRPPLKSAAGGFVILCAALIAAVPLSVLVWVFLLALGVVEFDLSL